MDFSKYQMINRYERIRALPESELERRWEAIRALMRDKGVNVILFADANPSATSMWLLGTGNKVPEYIVFPLDDDPIAFYGGKSQPDGSFNPYALAARTRIEPGSYGRVINANEFKAEAVSKYVNREKPVIGIFQPNAIRVSLRKMLETEMPGLEMVDLTHDISRVRSVKSPYDIELCRASAQMHTIFMEAVPSIVRPGRTQREVLMDLRSVAMEFGSGGEDMCLMMKIVDREHNRRSAIPWGSMDERRFQNDDMFWILLETSGPGGQFCANGRYWSFTEPGEGFLDRFNTAVRAQDIVQSLLKAGATIRNAADAANHYIRSAGYYTDDCCFIHSLGYAMGEYPMLSDHSIPTDPKSIDEDEPIQPGTILIAHPQVGLREKNARPDMVLLIETYLVEENGTEKLTTYPRDKVHLIQ